MTNIRSKWFSSAKYILGTRFRRFRQVWRRTAPVTWRRRRLTFVVALRVLTRSRVVRSVTAAVLLISLHDTP